MSRDEGELRLLDDLPVGAEGDSFQHSLYADMLAAVFRSGKPGRCVGFFGKWGQGKSSVVRQLKDKLEGQTTVITFNAWKSSGDSIRRQLLLYVIKKIDKQRYEELKRFVGVNVLRKLLLSEKEEERQINEERRTATSKTLSDLWLWMRVSPLLAVSLFLLFLGLVLVLTSIGAKSQILLSIALSALFPAGIFLALYVKESVHLRYLGYLTIGKEISESQRIRYPEQFEELFISHVSKYCRSNGDLVVVIDDLDRCNAHTIAEALAAIRQFTPDALNRAGEEAKRYFHCQFLVPCDEQQVVLALETAGHDAGSHGAHAHHYESKELLRKFFDITIRMHDIYQDDLSEYAGNLAEGINLDPQEAREIVALVGPQDPRLVKQLLNALRLSHDRLERQCQSEALPPLDELAYLEHTERLLVALRETSPTMYRKIAANPSILEDPDALGTSEEVASKEESDRAQRMLTAGRVSAGTAEILIHSKLPRLLHGVAGAGNLVRSVRRYNQDLFGEMLSNLRPDKSSDVQKWLTQEARRISERAATSLRQLLTLFLSYAKSKPKEEFIMPCLEAALASGSHVEEALSDHPQLNKLALLFPELQPRTAARIHDFLIESFLSADGESDSELQFLLATCKAMPEGPQDRFRTWLVEGLKADSKDGAFVRRISRLFPEDRSLCSGFAPEGAVAAAGIPQWEQVLGESAKTKHPRSDVVMSLLGHSTEHAAQCLDAILSGDGQLARPQPLSSANAGIEAAWLNVGCLLDLASDDGVQKSFKNMQPWLRLDPAQGSNRVLEALGKNVLRLADNQFSQLAQFIVGSLAQRPGEIWPVEAIGKAPNTAKLADRWKKLVTEVFNRYAKRLKDRPNLDNRAKATLRKMQELHWPVSDRAETLLEGKLQGSSRLQQFRPWLDALAPLVCVGSGHDTIRMKVLELIGRKRENVDKALAAGLAIPWAKEIDVESATSVGQLFIGQQSSLSQYADSWRALREKKGAGKVLDTMADELPEEITSLNSFTNPLNMISGDFGLLDAKHQRTFLDKTLLSLISTHEMTARQIGIDLSARVPRTTAALRKQLTLLIKEGSLSSEQEKAITVVVKKPLLRARRKTAS